ICLQMSEDKKGRAEKNPNLLLNISEQVGASCFCRADMFLLLTQHSHCVLEVNLRSARLQRYLTEAA
uniref:Uncharacterized protein n=1 Tax=Stegastes partitus TaxID=144197 RepID=A0A3B4ZYQ2_9TELE